MNEHQARAAAGITMALGAVAFVYANFDKLFWPIRTVSTFFVIDFLARVTRRPRAKPERSRRRGGWHAGSCAVGLGQAQAIRLDPRARHGPGNGGHHEQSASTGRCPGPSA